MSNVLRITTSTIGYDNPNLNNKPEAAARPDSRVQAPVVPNQVVRPDARSDASQNNQELAMKFKYQSNFEGFIAQMRAEGSTVQGFAPVLFERLSNMMVAGLTPEGLQQVQQFLKMIEVEPQNMASVLKDQSNGSLRFQGAFFELLRQVMSESRSLDLQAGILEFIKRYTDMAEGKHLTNQMEQVLKTIKDGMLKSGKEQLQAMEKQLDFNGGTGATAKNASVIKEQILPFLNKYVMSNNDRGLVRENSVLLAALTARYENGQAERVVEKFREIMEFPAMQQRFRGLQPEEILTLLTFTEFEKTVEKNRWIKEFAALIKEGVTKGSNPEQKNAFRSVMYSTVLNESVYMPVLHTMFPMKMGERLMMAEMWVDPDSEEKNSTGSSEHAVRALIKFSIQDLGFFDMFFLYQKNNNRIRLQLNYPEELTGISSKIESEIKEILSRNGIKADELYFGISSKPIPIEEAFPKIFERRNSINVKV